MADIIGESLGGRKQRFKDMGDGTFAEVVYDGAGSAGASTATTVGVAASATVVTLKAANTDRVELIIKNSPASPGTLYYKLGTGAAISSGNYAESLAPGESGYIDSYTGIVTGIWDSAASGFANVTEVA
jgi:hypothetical protein